MLEEVQGKRKELDSGLAEMEANLAGLSRQIERLEEQRQAATRETTQTKVVVERWPKEWSRRF